MASNDAVRFTDTDPAELITRLSAEDGKGIWICGGADLAQQLAAQNLIDVYSITIVPVLLGSGIRLFEREMGEIRLRLLEAKSCSGMTNLVYARKHPFQGGLP